MPATLDASDDAQRLLGLWRRAFDGDGPAREELARSAEVVIRRELARHGLRPDEIDDMTQATQLDVTECLGKPLAGGVRNVREFMKYRALGVLSGYRKRMRTLLAQKRVAAVLEEIPMRQEPSARMSKRQVLGALEDCLQRLSQTLRRAIELRYFNGQETGEIARDEGVARASVDVRMFRARELLHECMREKGFDAGDLP